MKEEKFNLFGSNWTVKYADKIEMDGDSGFQFGLTDYVNRIICIATKDSSGKQLPKEEIEITKLHELSHCILGTGMYADLSSTEPLVEWIGRCIYSLRQQKVIK
jgi:hypothetical protein